MFSGEGSPLYLIGRGFILPFSGNLLSFLKRIFKIKVDLKGE